MTPETVNTGWFMVGAALMTLGVLVIAVCIRRDPKPELEPIAPADLGRIEHDATVDYLAHVDSALRLVQGSNVIPMQRRAGEGS